MKTPCCSRIFRLASFLCHHSRLNIVTIVTLIFVSIVIYQLMYTLFYQMIMIINHDDHRHGCDGIKVHHSVWQQEV